MTKRIIMGLALLSFIASILGIIISVLLLKEDVLSTSHTVFEYFPLKFGVKPSATWEGAMVLGYFTSVLQIVSASIMLSDHFSKNNRYSAVVMFILSCAFDNYTDIIFRSGNLTGNLFVATVSTLAFYTVGSEVLSGFSLLVFFTFWRRAVSDLMWGIAVFGAGMRSIGAEWSRFVKAANTKEGRDRNNDPTSSSDRNSPYTQNKPLHGSGSSYQPKKPFTPFHSNQSQNSGNKNRQAEEKKHTPVARNMDEIRTLMEYNSDTRENKLRD